MSSPEIYLDSNATTPVLPQAAAAALAVMTTGYGNPSSVHTSGLKARACIDAVRAQARQSLRVPDGELIFVSGATEGIQTAILSALQSVRGNRSASCLLYGATEHKAVPEALHHWNELLGLGLEVLAIPVGRDGRHDLEWLRANARRAALVCTMAVNNETGVVSDLEGIAASLEGCSTRWLVDGVQALGKLPLDFARLPIDYAVFSGHKFYAPKGIGLLYVRDGVPLTPLIVGGGQERAIRSGTENLPAIAAMGAVLDALKDEITFRDTATLQVFRDRLLAALRNAFPGLVLNAPEAQCVPTTLNFSVPGLDARQLLNSFDAAGIRLSGGSACSAGSPTGSHVLKAMGLPSWQVDGAVRLSFGPATDLEFIDEACRRIRTCGRILQQQGVVPSSDIAVRPDHGVTRFVWRGACCYALVDAGSAKCIVVDPIPELTEALVQWLKCRSLDLVAVLDTSIGCDPASGASALRSAWRGAADVEASIDALGWPMRCRVLSLGMTTLEGLPVAGPAQCPTMCVWRDATGGVIAAFVGDAVRPGALGRRLLAQDVGLECSRSLRWVYEAVGPNTLLFPRQDQTDDFATTFGLEMEAQPWLLGALEHDTAESALTDAKADFDVGLAEPHHRRALAPAGPRSARPHLPTEVDAAGLSHLVRQHPELTVVDVRERHEQLLGPTPQFELPLRFQHTPVSSLLNALPAWLGDEAPGPLLFVCRTGSRSAAVARAVARLGHRHAFCLVGGLALL